MHRVPLIPLLHLFVAGLLTIGLCTPVFSADKKKKEDKSQSDAARDSIDKQKDIAKALKEKALTADPDAQQKQLDDLKSQLDAEKTRHTSATDSLNKDLKTYTDAKDKKHTDRTQKAIDKENESSSKTIADLEKQIADLKDKLEAAKGPTSKPAK